MADQEDHSGRKAPPPDPFLEDTAITTWRRLPTDGQPNPVIPRLYAPPANINAGYIDPLCKRYNYRPAKGESKEQIQQLVIQQLIQHSLFTESPCVTGIPEEQQTRVAIVPQRSGTAAHISLKFPSIALFEKAINFQLHLREQNIPASGSGHPIDKHLIRFSLSDLSHCSTDEASKALIAAAEHGSRVKVLDV
ncbi:hypothetical protein BJ508DRAFT_337059 [Ascobolus immersus RN42]|uniref:Uncharacterized protein n=1 Tax=Ascobolus immersus RN42 TaxID=1160509 RepID=A0A3N4H976_ASCIM|nr:hypothetical protein BJ508DRAFT_337059 [Ascobolus immersus RN42]